MKPGDYVKRKGAEDPTPTGIVDSVTLDPLNVIVRWGVQDRRVYKEEIPITELQIIQEKIVTPNELLKRHAKENSALYHEFEED